MWIVARSAFRRICGTLSPLAQGDPGKATVGIAGVGGGGDVVTFSRSFRTSFQLVPYRGGAPLIQDLVASQITSRSPWLRARSRKPTTATSSPMQSWQPMVGDDDLHHRQPGAGLYASF
jgi:hypothetical protein